MLEVVYGKSVNPMSMESLVNSLSGVNWTGTLYIGYPIFDIDDETVLTDALLITQDHGLVIFDMTTTGLGKDEREKIVDYQDGLYLGINSKFSSDKSLATRKGLKFDPLVISLRASADDEIPDNDCFCVDSIVQRVELSAPLSDELYCAINAAIQKTSVLKPPKKRDGAVTEQSYGWKIKNIEKEIANLDKWQKKAAIESPDGPQRIRGLAGCGKTIILAMKAAYLHAYNPDAKILITFQTRALYQQLKSLISRFYFEHVKEEINPDNLHILHSWGSRSDTGVYAEFCRMLGVTPYSFYGAQSKFGRSSEFSGACGELLSVAKASDVKPIYDYVLVDEAQDLPPAFFQILYMFAKRPKRIVWAYDELQNLSNERMLPPEELFGLDANGVPNVRLFNEAGRPVQDIMLNKCYRNPPWTLSLALALGLGVYKADGLVRMFRDPNIWKDIGYDLVSGSLGLGQRVKLRRSTNSTPEYFSRLIEPKDSIICEVFEDKIAQAEWAADQIKLSVEEGELELSDILVIFPDPYTMSSDSSFLRSALRKRGIESHMAGADQNRNVMFLENSIAFAHVYRAKGNEAPMVFLMDSNYCYSGFDLGKKRNFLFTAITRTKGWVRILGVGEGMKGLKLEVDKFFQENFELDFYYPSEYELERLESAYQDKSPEEISEARDSFERVRWIKRMIKQGKMTVDDLPPEIRDLFE